MTLLCIKRSRLVDHLNTGHFHPVFKWFGFQMPSIGKMDHSNTGLVQYVFSSPLHSNGPFVS
jgi:hypothetical protein